MSAAIGYDSPAYASEGDSDGDGDGDGDSDGDGDDGDSDSDGGDDGGRGSSSGNSSSSGSGGGENPSNNYNRKLKRLHEGVQNKSLLPLSVLKAIVVARYGNSIIEIETKRKSGRWQYEFKLINRKGRLLEVYVDGQTGRIIRVEND